MRFSAFSKRQREVVPGYQRALGVHAECLSLIGQQAHELGYRARCISRHSPSCRMVESSQKCLSLARAQDALLIGQ
jgi:hypothetical protein